MNHLDQSYWKTSPFYLCSFFYVLFSVIQVNKVHAGSFLFADEGIENTVTHPEGYDWNISGQITVDVCIVPGSPNASTIETSIKNVINTWNKQYAKTGNLISGGNNELASNEIDFESVALHELGHCIGLAHPNSATESGLSGANLNYTRATNGLNNVLDINAGTDGIIGTSDDLRGDDQNLHWFRISNNNPFTIDSIIDSTTYARELTSLPGGHSFAANADRTVGSTMGFTNSEAVMQQGTFFDETQRHLGHDDVATYRLAMSGVDMIQATTDDYTIQLNYAGITNFGCEINVSFDNSKTGFAQCNVNASSILFNPDHVRLTSADVYFNDGFNWYINSTSNAIDLSIDMQSTPEPVTAGTQLTYTVSVTNNSTLDAEEVVVTTSLPNEVSFISTSGCNEDPLAYPICTLGNISGSGAKQYTIITTVDGGTSGLVSASALVDSVAFVDPDTNNNASSLDSTVNADSDSDALSDVLEQSICTNELDIDSDDDGLSDGAEDTNSNGLVDANETDPCNADSDSDGIQDGTESGVTAGIVDPDDMGNLLGTDTSVFIPDDDPLSTTDPIEPDTDGDGANDGEEDLNINGRVDNGETDPNDDQSIPEVQSFVVPLPYWATTLLFFGLIAISLRSQRRL